jgi:hypothetical protein
VVTARCYKEVGLVFGRRQAKTHGRLMREELNESFDHLRMAAAHAAGGAAGALAPRLGDAKKAASDSVDTMLDAARESARQANMLAQRGTAKMTTRMRKKPAARRRWPRMASGLLVAGAAAGAAGALVSRRRARRSWNEYGTAGTTEEARSMLDSAKSAMGTAKEEAAETLGAASERLSRDTGTMSESVGQPRPGDRDKGNTLGQYSGQAGTISKNARP